MKQTSQNIIKVIVGVSAVLTLCGTTALADPYNSMFLQIDMDGGGGPTQPNFQSWPVPTQSANTYSWVSTMTFYPSNWVYSNQFTPSGAVTITVIGTNNEVNVQTNIIDPFPSWAGGIQYSPNGMDRGTMSGETWGPLYEDFLSVSHDTAVGMGEDFVQVTISNLAPNTNYEITVFDYDQYVSDGSPGYYTAWTTQNPDPYGTNSFQPGKESSDPYVQARLARVLDGGGWPSQVKPGDQEFAYSKSFFVTTDANGSVTVYGFEDDDTWGGMQWVPFNGFAIGYATNYVFGPSTNIFTNILVNPPLAAAGPPTVWPYFSCINIAATNYLDTSFTLSSTSSITIIGQAFTPTRDLMLRNFYVACRVTNNTGRYVMDLYDLGVTNMANVGKFGSFYITNPIAGANVWTNLLAHPSGGLIPLQYWEIDPTNWITNNYTNTYIVKFKLPSPTDQVYLTNGHAYFLGFECVGGNNNLVLESTTNAYAYGTAFGSYGTLGSTWFMTNMNRNLIMAVDVLNPNPVISVTNYPLTASTTNWPTLAGMANGGNPVITVQVDQSDPYGGADPGFLDFLAGSGSAGYITVGTGEANSGQSMGFYNTNTFNLGAVAVVMHGVGSSNCLFTLNVWQVTNTFFTATNTVEKFPRNFQPNTDTAPLSTPIFLTNVDFYYPTNLDGGGVYPYQGITDQILVLTLPQQYQLQILGSANEPYKSYVVELCADLVGENASAVGLFMLERNLNDSSWQNNLFPSAEGCSTGSRTNVSTNGCWEITPFELSRNYPDPERFAGMSAGTGSPRQLVMALYAANAAPIVPPTNIVITSVTRSGNNVVLNWTESGGSGAYTYSVLRTNLLKAAKATWPAIVTNLSTNQTTYTDTNATATGQNNFYIIHSP